MTSSEYTVTLAPGTYDVIQRCSDRVLQAALHVQEATTKEEQTASLKAALELALNLNRTLLGSVLRSSEHDGNVRLAPDGPESIWFKYDSGYHGAMILHGADTPRQSWSIHT